MASKKKAGGRKTPRSKKPEPTARELQAAFVRVKGQNDRLSKELSKMAKASKAQQKKIAALEKRMAASVKREDILMAALEIGAKPKKGEKGAVGRITQSLLTTDEHVLAMGKRIESMLSALKNHREFLIRLNKKVYKVDPVKKMEMELGIIGNTLSIMALSGYDIDKGLFKEMKRINKMLEKEDADLAKVQKRMATFRNKFKDEMGRFDLESVFKKIEIPGYR